LKTFEELDLIAPIQRALVDEKYSIPTPIQAQTIPAALEGSDVLGCAQTGTGKTAAFALPILSQLGKQSAKAIPNHPFVLALAPTRELAIQIADSFTTYGKHLRLRHALVYGGVSQVNQVRAMKKGSHILVATPGRLLDLMNQGHIKLNQLQMFVLDEADQMLDMGFLPDLKRIIKQLPQNRQSLFFSATLSSVITDLSHQLLRNPVSVNVTPKTRTLKKIDQRLVYVDRSDKQKLLKKILRGEEVERALVFTKTKRMANQLSLQLVQNGIRATAIHGNKSQGARQRALESFKRKQVQVLVATDVAARGIDIDNITHVINYDLPVEPEAYVHRIGRTGRAGAEGIAMSFCCGGERKELRAIERLIGHQVPIDAEHSMAEPPAEERSAPRGHGGRGRSFSRSGGGGVGGGGNHKRRSYSKRSESGSGASSSSSSSSSSESGSGPQRPSSGTWRGFKKPGSSKPKRSGSSGSSSQATGEGKPKQKRRPQRKTQGRKQSVNQSS